MYNENFQLGVNTDQSGRAPSIAAPLSMTIMKAADEGYVYQSTWSHDFAPGSRIDASGLVLRNDIIYRMGEDDEGVVRLYSSDNVRLYCETYWSNMLPMVTFRLAAKTEEARSELHKQLQANLIKNTQPPPEDKIAVNFWRQHMSGGDFSIRNIDYAPWCDIEPNYYNGKVRDALGQLMKLTPENIRGKLMLLYGPAGTGKTRLLGSLVHAWKDWSAADYIIDPEAFLNSPGYMMDVLVGRQQYNYHRLVILEDSGELISKNAKASAGQVLSRLLNLTDGMLGSGRKLLIAITTNDAISELHPAVTRPGRCLINAEIGPMTPVEARDWLGPGHERYPIEPATLAELYNIRYGGEKSVLGSIQEPRRDGAYL